MKPKKQFKQLRIRAYLQTPVISDVFLPLDSVLYYHHCRRFLGTEYITKSNESNIREAIVPLLPFRKSGPKNEAWFYACSFAVWSKDVAEEQTFKVKSGDWIRHNAYLESKVKKVETTKGKYKNAMIRNFYRHSKYVDWFCIGNPGELAELLQFCRAIGKNTGDGWGQVLRWELSEWEHDWHCRGLNNRLMRAVPAEGGIPYGVRPSYWNPRHIVPCLLPE